MTGDSRGPNRREFARFVRVFVSSPSDVLDLRQAAKKAIGALNDHPDLGERFKFEALLYEDEVGPEMGAPGQQLVDRRMGMGKTSDVFVLILGQRLGTPYRDGDKEYPSGTAYEFEGAYEARRQGERPLILAYRCTRATPDVPREESLRLQEYLTNFSARPPRFEGLGPRVVANVGEFSRQFPVDLANVVRTLSDRYEDKPKRLRWLVLGAAVSALAGAGVYAGQVITACERETRAILSAGLSDERTTGGDSVTALWDSKGRELGQLGMCASAPLFDSLAEPEIWQSREAIPTVVGVLFDLGRGQGHETICRKMLALLNVDEGPRYPERVLRATLESVTALRCANRRPVACDIVANLWSVCADDPAPDDFGPLLRAATAAADGPCPKEEVAP